MSTQTKRRCNGKTCITILSSYNSDTDGLCGACRLAETDAAVLRFRAQMEKREEAEAARLAKVVAGDDLARHVFCREELVAKLQAMTVMLGRTPTADDCGGIWPARGSFERHFGTWGKAREAAGIPMPKTTRSVILKALEKGPRTTTFLARRTGTSANNVGKVLIDLRRRGMVSSTPGARHGSGGAAPLVWRLVKERPA